MLFMIIVKASKNSEGNQFPNMKLQLEMDLYNEALEAAGVKVMAKGLHPSANAMRISFKNQGESPIVTHGPFDGQCDTPNNIIAGFFLLDVATKEEAVAWAMKCPDPQGDGEGEIELRQVF